MTKASAKTKRTVAIVRADLNHIKDTLRSAAHDMTQNVKERTDDFQDKWADKISDQPFKFVAIAALSGAVVGFLMRGRKNHSHYDD